jgi:muconolactone delta-isomerase
MTGVIAPKAQKLEEEKRMIVLAKGSITEPGALAPYVDDEMRAVRELKSEGVMKAIYRRAAGPGVYLILDGPSIDALKDRVGTLPFVVENLMTVDYDEIYEI